MGAAGPGTLDGRATAQSAGVKPLAPLAVFGVFVLTQLVSWFAPLLLQRCEQSPSRHQVAAQRSGSVSGAGYSPKRLFLPWLPQTPKVSKVLFSLAGERTS